MLPEVGGRQVLSLAANTSARFVDAWTPIEVDAGSACVWTAGLVEGGYGEAAMCLPVAHGEGRLVAESDGVMDGLIAGGQVPLRYGVDVNGSAAMAAGVCDASGRVFGLMPHPERYLDWASHPHRWSVRDEEADGRETPGLAMFRGAVAAVGAGV